MYSPGPWQVLSDSEKHAIYDQYGEEGLKGQFSSPSPTSSCFSNGSGPNGFRFNPKNVEDIFAEFFGANGFPNMQSIGSRPGSSRFNDKPYGFSQGNSVYPRKDPPIESKLKCTLEELYNGAVRKMKISRDVLNGNGWVFFFPLSLVVSCRYIPVLFLCEMTFFFMCAARL